MSSKHVPSEESQLAVLESDAPLREKAVACHKLVYVAGPKSVAPLAALLADEVMSDYARSGLEAIEDASASQALLDALPKLKGRMLAGVVNSLGVRREVKAIAPLQRLATEPSSEVRTEALASLGMIATPEVVPTLESGLKAGPELRTAAGHAGLIAVGHLRADGEAEAAAGLLKAILAAFPDGPILAAAKRL